jgi:PAS domain-containing protein
MSPSKPIKRQDSAAVEYWRVFRELPLPCMLFEANDPEFTIVDMNRARELQGNTTREKHIGHSLPKEFPIVPGQYGDMSDEKMLDAIHDAMKTGKPRDVKFLRHDRASKGVVHMQRTFIPIKNDAGTVTHFVAVTQDVTEERGKMRKVFETEGRLEAALAIGKVGSWLWNLETDTIIADPIIAKMMGIPVKQALCTTMILSVSRPQYAKP